MNSIKRIIDLVVINQTAKDMRKFQIIIREIIKK